MARVELVNELEELRRFVRMVHRWRRIPVVDADFPESRDEVDRECDRLIAVQMAEPESDAPTVVHCPHTGREVSA